jgi:hypothetical protein
LIKGFLEIHEVFEEDGIRICQDPFCRDETGPKGFDKPDPQPLFGKSFKQGPDKNALPRLISGGTDKERGHMNGTRCKFD